MSNPLIYEKTEAFQRNFQRLFRKFRTLEQDFELAKKATLEIYHLQKINTNAIFPVPGCGSQDPQIYKLKKFACRSLKGRGSQSGIRVIYAFYPRDGRVVFLEIYFKADQELEDRQRIADYLKEIKKS